MLWNNDVDEARNFYIDMGGNHSDSVYDWGDKVELEIAALDLNKNNSQQKVWHRQHNQNNINQVENVDGSNMIGKIIIGLVFLAILF